ncbi:hypothetical protein GCM10028771_36880 [Nocardioides marmoraquaticus]
MREAAETAVWKKLRQSRTKQSSREHAVGAGTVLDLAQPCIVLGGRNGAGKTRLLRRLDSELGKDALLIDLHQLTQEALSLYRSRADFDDMTDEVDPLVLGNDRIQDVQKIVGRRYDSIEWFSLEIELNDPDVAERFRWMGDADAQPLVPYFRVSYRGLTYSSPQMGLGEFSVHLLFWIVELLRTERGQILLLDEPDAYLPPIGVRSLLARMLQICLHREWSVVLSTHSEEMIALAVENDGFTLLAVDEAGETSAVHSADDPMAASTLLTRPPVDRFAFVEDESAAAMTRGLIGAVNPSLAQRTSLVWGGGDGYLKELRKHLPKPPQPAARFAYVLDGDQRGSVHDTLTSRWEAVFLPTGSDPDELMRELADDVYAIAGMLNVPAARVQLYLGTIEGDDAHDWVNKMGEEFGRPEVLRALPALWAERYPEEAQQFVAELSRAWG